LKFYGRDGRKRASLKHPEKDGLTVSLVFWDDEFTLAVAFAANSKVSTEL
jgi:hypothetical protein